MLLYNVVVDTTTATAYPYNTLSQGPPGPGPQEAVVISDSGAVDDGETLTSDRLRKGRHLGNAGGLQVVMPAISNGPALATVGPSSRQPSPLVEDAEKQGGNGSRGTWDQGHEQAMDTCSLEERAVMLAQQLGLQAGGSR